MPKYHFYLKDYKAEESPINLVIRYSRNTITFFTREHVAVKYWDRTNERPAMTRSYPECADITERLDNILYHAKKLFRDYQNSHDNREPGPSDFKKMLEEHIRGTRVGTPTSLMPFFEFYIKQVEFKMKADGYAHFDIKRRKWNYLQTYNCLKDFSHDKNRKVDFDTMDAEFISDWIAYMEKIKIVWDADGNKTTMYGFSANNIGKHVKNLKHVLNEASSPEIGVNKSMYYKRFRILREETEAIYLSEGELEELFNLDLGEDKNLEGVRDLFLVGCWTGLRFSDFTNIQAKDIQGEMIHIRTQKTGAAVVIPIHWMVQRIMGRYMDRGNNLPPSISNVKMNKQLKELGKKMESLRREVEITYTKAGKQITTRRPRYEMLTTHTARRSFATNMYKAGVPTITIMRITGHKTEGNFLRYIKVTPDEHAYILKSYFKGPKLKAV